MSHSQQTAKAEAFRRLHDRSRILVLPNIWDPISARIIEAAGFPAIATSSASVAWALGFADGESMGREEMLRAVARIARAVQVPVTADLVAGFGTNPGEVAQTVEELVATGAVGMNLEDGIHETPQTLVDMKLHAEKVAAAKEAGRKAGVPLVINARTDVFLAGVGEPATRLEHAIRRANAYREAGADCLFVPAVRDAETIATLVREIQGPVNILARAGALPIGELAQLGVARVSLGPGPMEAALGLLRQIANELQDAGTYTKMHAVALPYAELNALMTRNA